MNPYIIIGLLAFAGVSILLWPVCRAKNLPLHQRRLFTSIVSIVFVVGSLLLYRTLGTPEILPLLAEREAKLESLKTSLTNLSAELQRDPKNLMAWVEMGDNFMQTSQYAAAANAYKQGVLLSAGDPVLILAYARALIASEEGKVNADAKRSLQMVLMLQPKNEEARYFLATEKLQSGNMQEAMQEMKTLYRSLPDDSPLKARINRQIGRE